MKLSKFKISLLFVAIFGVFSVGIAIAQVPPSGSGDNTISTPPSGDGSNTGGTSPSPVAGNDSNTGGTTPPPPSGNDSNTGGTTPPPPAGNGLNTGGTTPPPPSGNGSNTGGTGNSPSNPPTSPIIIFSGGNGAPISLPSFSGVGGGAGIINPNPSVTPGMSFACNPYINRYMTLGANNDYDEVVKLQIFLKDVEHLNVDVTGKYDLKTFEAVKAFQQRYADDVLKKSWGISIPTGIVFFTTRLKINDIYCKTSTNFSTLNLPRIVFNQNVNTNTTGGETPVNNVELPLPGQEPSTIPPELIGQNEPTNSVNGSENVAAVGKSGIRRFFDSVGDFFNRIFGSKGPATTTTTTTVTSTTTTEVETSGNNK